MTIETEGFEAVVEFTKNVVESAIAGTVLELASRVQKDTPVDKGFAQNSWFVTTSPDDFGAVGQNELGFPTQWRMGGGLYLNNGAEYISELEKGHSQQAPAGMVAINLPQIPAILGEQVRDAERAQK